MTWTQEQIDEKAKDMFECRMGFGLAWDLQKEADKEYWRKKILAAQLPIAEVAEEEWDKAYKELQRTCAPYAIEVANKVLANRRNAPPNPDLIDEIAEVINEMRGRNSAVIAQRILAIVKEETK